MDRDDGAGEKPKVVVSEKLKGFVEGHAKKLEALLLEMAKEVIDGGIEDPEDRVTYTAALWTLLDAEARKIEYIMCMKGLATPQLFEDERIKNRLLMAMATPTPPTPDEMN